MRSTVSVARMVRVLALAIPFVLPFLSGCDLESYPDDLAYPLRSDPLVTAAPLATKWDTIGPGQLTNHILHDADLEGRTLDPAKLDGKSSNKLDVALTKIFGTPAAPTVEIEGQEKRLAALKLDKKENLAKGSKVYRRHCMHCHGVTGDGRGPTAPWVSPTPRDYRQGLFKFMSTDQELSDRKPRREDLRRTLEHGIEGTSMPSFSLLEEEEKENLISYVIHLSLRGQAEYRVMSRLLNKSELDGTIAEEVDAQLTDDRKGGLVNAWWLSNQEDRTIKPPTYPYDDTDQGQRWDSIERGYRIFTDPKGPGSCIACHADFGRQVPFRYDNWGTLVRPANLTAGIYRGGRRPIDLYWRIRGGIEPSQMPKADFGDKGTQKALWEKGDPYWDLVNFLQALPYPRMLPPRVSKAIYGREFEETKRASR